MDAGNGMGRVWTGRGFFLRAVPARCGELAERTGPEGCWILASTPLGKFPLRQVFWTLDVYPNQESAQAAAGKGSTVLTALDRVWLLTVGDKPPAPVKARRSISSETCTPSAMT